MSRLVQQGEKDDQDNYAYDYFDRLRVALTQESTSGLPTVHGEPVDGSSIVQVQTAAVDDGDGEDEGNIYHKNRMNTTTHRLMHIAVAIGLSRGGVVPHLPAFDQAKVAIMAQHHFNNRIESVVPNLRQLLTNEDDGSECDLRLTMDFYDTAFNPRVAVTVLTRELYVRPFPYETSAIVGAFRSAVSIPMSVLNTAQGIPQVSYISKSTELNDRGPHAFFGRVITDIIADAQAAIDYFSNVLHTTHLGILYIDDAYGTGYRLELERVARKARIRTQAFGVSVGQSLTDDLRADLLRAAQFFSQTGYQHFIGITFAHQFEGLLEIGTEWGIMGPGKLWLFGDAVYVNLVNALRYPPGSPQAIALHGTGILTVGGSTGDEDPFKQAFLREQGSPGFLDYWATKTPRFTDSVQFMSNYTSGPPGDFSRLTYDAVMSLGIAGCQSSNTFPTGTQLFEEFTNSDFYGASGRVLIDKQTGSRVYTSARYIILNIQSMLDEETNMIRSNIVVASKLEQTSSGPQWRSSETGTVYNYSDNTTIPPPSLPLLQVADIVDTSTYWTLVSLAGVVMLSSVGFALWTILNRKSYVIRVSQPSFLLFICVGEFFMASSVVLFGTQSPPFSKEWAEYSCMPAIWIFAFGFSLLFSALFAKTRRVYKLLGRQSSFRRITITMRDAALPGCFLVLGSLLVLAAWQVTDPLHYKLEFDEFGSVDQFERPLQIVSTCAAEKGWDAVFGAVLLLIMGITLLAANLQAYKARHITTEYSESVYIGWSMAISLQGIILSVPAFLFDPDLRSSFFARSALLLLLSSSTLFLMFIPKLYHHKAYVKKQKKKAAQRLARERMSKIISESRLSTLNQDDSRVERAGSDVWSNENVQEIHGSRVFLKENRLGKPKAQQ